MNITTKRPTPLASALACVGFLLVAGQCAAADYYLCAKPGTVTMPGGEVVPIWGYVKDDNDNLADGCPGNPDLQSTALTVPAADAGLTVHLRNDLSEPTSIVIPGQTAAMTPVWFEPASPGTTYAGSRPAGNTTARVRSFTHETAPGATADYTWGSIKPGTYLYHSGTHPQVQVQMGLYGAVTKNFADAGGTPAEAYDGDSYDAELTLLFSELDPAQHAAIVAGTYGDPGTAPDTPCPNNNNVSAPDFLPMTSTLCYKPKYFLINGQAYPDSMAGLPTVEAGKNTLLRFLNAGLRSYVPTVQGTNMKMLAEDGNRYQYRVGNTFSPRDQYQYSTLLASLKTTDAIISPTTLGDIVIYDRRLHLVNDLTQDGGMFVKLATSGTVPPTGGMVINGGAAATNSRSVTVTLHASDATQMRFSWDNVTWFGWEPYAASRNITLPNSEGTNTLYVRFRNAANVESPVYSDSIVLDRVRPTGTVQINGGDGSTALRAVVLNLSATDATTSVSEMRLLWAGQAWQDWQPYATTVNATIPIGVNGTKRVYVQFRDTVGNVSATATDVITLSDVTSPVGTVQINNGEATTNNANVILYLNATDANEVTHVRWSWYSPTSAWSAWLPYEALVSATIVGGAGQKNVRVQFRDGTGRISSSYTDSIDYAP